ncbi:hypothetical protein SCLCIDRAFT_1217351 [Scleroderma citrinum Foug A]|uniref:Uncharacterized protein n=1 Tax=Scleroderma citrinum Foug A TaxID=1036808 RepID=A0A0C3DUQ8_9AGAM|nr:hypothetical protein SCLCIDRAFT_1217351 [Scleroderma citrinum Foug A]
MPTATTLTSSTTIIAGHDDDTVTATTKQHGDVAMATTWRDDRPMPVWDHDDDDKTRLA